MLLTEISLPKSREEAEEKLLASGYAKIGSGYAGDVYAKEGDDFVIKIFHVSDKAYEAFIKMVTKNPNTHFPKIRGKLRITPAFKAVRLERLTEFTGTDAELWNIKTYLHARIYKREIKTTLSESMCEACELIAEIPLKINEDVKRANVMMRGDVLVLIDPIV